VDVKRDGYGIPQIYASTDADLFMAQGYVQAQDRFYEMDVRRHMTAGKLSEMFGEGQVDNDEFLRTLGWDRVAEKEYETKLSAETKKYLQAYAKGVNAYLKGKDGADISLEYAALGFTNDYKPKEWTPVDSVAWLKAMAWDLRGNMQDEIDRSLMTSRLGPKQIADLYPQYPYDRNKPIVQEGQYDSVSEEYEQGSGHRHRYRRYAVRGGHRAREQHPTAPSGLQSQLSGLYKVLDDVPEAVGVNGNGIGSNSWVVKGTHTITGKPLLANDPHLSPSLPSVWYQMGLHCRASPRSASTTSPGTPSRACRA
jgi:penicillin amidase